MFLSTSTHKLASQLTLLRNFLCLMTSCTSWILVPHGFLYPVASLTMHLSLKLRDLFHFATSFTLQRSFSVLCGVLYSLLCHILFIAAFLTSQFSNSLLLHCLFRIHCVNVLLEFTLWHIVVFAMISLIHNFSTLFTLFSICFLLTSLTAQRYHYLLLAP